MGVNIPENKSEGSSFESALGFHEADREKKPLAESTGEWERVVDKYIVQTGVQKPGVNRPTKIEYYLKMAETASLRGTCLRRKFGAIIVKNDEIISTGYVGAPRGRMNCCDRGTCFRMENNIPSGQRYELCRSSHAEMNAIISASRSEMEGSVMYLCGVENDGSYTEADCCSMCKRMIINAGIKYVIFRTKDGKSRQVDVEEWITNDDSLTLHEGY